MNISGMMQAQWFKRADDEKFASVQELLTAAETRRERSRVVKAPLSSLVVREHPLNPSDLAISAPALDQVILSPTNWTFGQLCNRVGAHPSYLGKLPSRLAAECLNYNIKEAGLERDSDLGLLVEQNGHAKLRSTSSASYGRIWDDELAQASLEILDRTGERFYSPLDWTKQKRALFMSDRASYLMFIDGGSIVDAGYDARGNPDQLNRGWIIGNSEVGAMSFFTATFLFRWVCGNFAIHGLEDVKFTRIRHSPGAPHKFASEAIPLLNDYTQASPRPLEQIIAKMKDFTLPKNILDFEAFFRARKFTQGEVQRARLLAAKDEGGHDTLWQMMNGFTKLAQGIRHTDLRVDLESRAGNLLKMAA